MRESYEPPSKIWPPLSETEKGYSYEIKFDSLTRRMLQPSSTGIVVCSSCGNRINFRGNVEWYGPHHFKCTNCSRILHMGLVAKTLRDMGYE